MEVDGVSCHFRDEVALLVVGTRIFVSDLF